METGIELIAKERERQINEEGWSFNHDDNHVDDEMAFAAACYAIPELERDYIDTENGGEIPALWPWKETWWKPEYEPNLEKKCTVRGRIKELTKAGALIAAEIDRLIRGEYEEGMRKAEEETIID